MFVIVVKFSGVIGNLSRCSQKSRVFTQPRPIAAVHSGHPMLQCSPSKQSFAAGAKSTLAKTHSLRDEAPIRRMCAKGRIQRFATAVKDTSSGKLAFAVEVQFSCETRKIRSSV